MAEDRDLSDFVDDVDEDESDDENQNFEESDTVTDTSAAQARRGKDIQGIPWNRFQTIREIYRQTRLKDYRNFENIRFSGGAVDMRYKMKPDGGNYYEFFHNSTVVRPTIFHFQLRNLVWATSKHDVYVLSNHSIMHWSSITKKLTEIVNFFGHVAPTEKHDGSLLEGFTETLITTFAVKDDFLVAGGSQGELVCKRLDKQGVSFCTKSCDDSAIINAIEIYDALRGGMHFMASISLCGVKEYEMDGFQLVNHFPVPFTVNHTSLSPDRKLIAVVGDHRDGLLVDRLYNWNDGWHSERSPGLLICICMAPGWQNLCYRQPRQDM